jgi:asparagine synthase (glutamine-hydrolysing)
MFSARDHFGIKPFYYHLSENLFAFATEIKGLLVLPQISECVNEIQGR